MRHPHAEASYRIIPFEGTFFAVEVRVPDTHPTTVSKFSTEAAAEKWIAEHRHRVALPIQGCWYRRTTTPSTRPADRQQALPPLGAPSRLMEPAQKNCAAQLRRRT
jgi:hypothetical protein